MFEIFDYIPHTKTLLDERVQLQWALSVHVGSEVCVVLYLFRRKHTSSGVITPQLTTMRKHNAANKF